MRALAIPIAVLCMASSPALAAGQDSAAEGEPIFVWERGKDGDDPLAALVAMTNLPRGTAGQPREELREQLLAAGARIVSEDEDRIVVRGKMGNGAELNVDFNYHFENGVYVPGSGRLGGSRTD